MLSQSEQARSGPRLAVAPMQQLKHANEADDDWTGLKDRAERKKRQTRLNVRAHRLRKAAAAQQQQAPPTTERRTTQKKQPQDSTVSRVTALPTIYPTALSAGPIRLPLPPGYAPFCTPTLPLSADHLIPLIYYNVHRAALTNISILSLSHLVRSPACAYLPDLAPPLFPRSAAPVVPEALRPTALQRATPHELWIDITHSAAMRDNAMRAVQAGVLCEGEVCADLLAGLGGNAKGELGRAARDALRRADAGEDARMIVWTTPWEAGGWEVTPGFVRKYGFLLRGARDLLQSTNKWRALRGDDALVWEVE